MNQNTFLIIIIKRTQTLIKNPNYLIASYNNEKNVELNISLCFSYTKIGELYT